MITLSDLIWSVSILLESALLIRSTQTGLYRRYPLFYAYISCVLLKDPLAFGYYRFAPNLYPGFYWYSELVITVVSFAVLIEVFQRSVRHNPGVMRFSQTFLVFAFGLTAAYASADFAHHGFTSVYHTIADLGRDLRSLEGVLLIVLLWLVLRYKISFGRNLLGLVAGLSFWIGINLVDFAFLSAGGNESSVFLRTVVPASYAITLSVWFWSLWSMRPEPVQGENQLEDDYEFLAARTRTLLARTSHRLAKAIKP